MIDPVIAEKIEVKSLFPFFWDTRYVCILVLTGKIDLIEVKEKKKKKLKEPSGSWIVFDN